MSRWSKLDRDWRKLVAPGLDARLQCRVVRMASERGSAGLPRYWVEIRGRTIWSYPADCAAPQYPHQTDVGAISQLVRDYINTPACVAHVRQYPQDLWGLADILRAMDRRIGRKRLAELLSSTPSAPAREVLRERLSSSPARKA